MSDDATTGGDPTPGEEATLDEIERELRLVHARERAAALAEAAAMRRNLPTRVDEPASIVPYLGATGAGGAAMLAGVFAFGLPAGMVATYGLTFLALGMGLKRLDDVPPDHPNAVLRWVGDRMERLGEKFGIETYGLMALTTFFHYEVASLSVPAVAFSQLFVDFPGNLIVWFVQEMIETVMNMVWAGLWWLPLFSNLGWGIALSIIAAAWAVIWVLDMPEGGEDEEDGDEGGRPVDGGLGGSD